MLVNKRKMPVAQAQSIMQLLHSFDDTVLAQPELYKMLVKFLDHDRMGIRGLAHWHLSRLVPAGKKIGFNPLDPKEKRDKARSMEEVDRRHAGQGTTPAQGSTQVRGTNFRGTNTILASPQRQQGILLLALRAGKKIRAS